MKAIGLASAMTILLLLMVTVAFRLFPTPQRARQMVMIYLLCLALLVVIWVALPPDCWFLPPAWLAEPGWLDLALCLFFFSAAFFGGALQLYNLADRGFSLRMLVDILEAPGGTGSVELLMIRYGGGRGLAWMYSKRMAGLLEGQFVVQRNDVTALTKKGARFADLFIQIRGFLKLAPVP